MKKLTTLFIAVLILASCGQSSSADKEEVSKATKSTEETTEVVVNDTSMSEPEQSSTFMVDQNKLSQMFWSAVPSEGYVTGDYIYGTNTFGNNLTAEIKLVKKGDDVVVLEFDEIPPSNYYDPRYAGVSKRFSDYGFFQASQPQTDQSLKVLVNGFTEVEQQYLESNNIAAGADTVAGASGSVSSGFIPLLNQLQNTPASGEYHSYTKKYDDFVARVEVVYDNDDNITSVFYDEIFLDKFDDIKDPELKKYYRQSKYHSIDYDMQTGDNFKLFSDDVSKQIIENQSFANIIGNFSDIDTFRRFEEVLQELQNNMQ